MADKSTGAIVDEILHRLERWGAKRQDPNGVAIEPHGKAPELLQFGSATAASCCKLRGPGGIPNVKGIRVHVTVSFRGQGGSGVQRVSSSGLDREGGIPIDQCGETWKLTPAEHQKSVNGSVTHEFSLCFRCTSLTHDHTARFEFIAEDDRGNVSIQVVGITIGDSQFKQLNCC